MSLPTRFKRSVVTGYLRTGTTTIVTLVTTPLLIDGLGTEAFGIWILVTSFALFRDLLQFGFVTATPKYVAEYTALEDHERVRGVVATSFWLLTIPAAVVLLIGLALAAFFPTFFDVPPDLRDASRILVLVLTIDFAIATVTDSFSGALMGLQRYDLLNVTLVFVTAGQAIGWVIVLATGGGLVALGVVTAAVSIAGQIARIVLVRRLIPGLSVSPSRIDRALIKPYAGLSVWLAIEDAAFVLLTRSNVIVVGAVLGVEASAIYGVGQKLTLAVGQLVQPVSALFFPHSSELAAKRDTDALQRSLLTGTRMLVAVAIPLSLTVALLAGPLLTAWVGDGFGSAVSVVVLLAATVAVTTLSDTGLVMLQGKGDVRAPALMRGTEALLNLGFSIPLAYLIGVEGAALGALLAAIAMNLLTLFPYICRRFDLSVRQFVGLLVRANGPPALVVIAIGLLVEQADPTTAPVVIAAAVAMVAAYVAVFAWTGLSADERRVLAARARGMWPGSDGPAASGGASDPL